MIEKKTSRSLFVFFKNQKIGTKILAGYLVAFLLAAFIGALAYYQFTQVSATLYQLTGPLAQERDLAEETATQIHLLRLYTNQYIYQGQNPADLEAYNQAIGDAQTLLNEATQIPTKKSRAEIQMQVRKDFNGFAASFAEIVQLLADRQAMVRDVLTPQGASSVDKLAVLRDSSFEILDFTTAHFASQAHDAFSQMQVNVNQYLETGNGYYANQVDTNFASINSTYDLLQASIREDTSRKLLKEIQMAAAAYYQGFQHARSGVARQHDLTTSQLDAFGLEIDKLTTVIANDINAEFSAQSQATNVFVKQIQNVTAGMIVSVVILGMIFGLLLSQAITRPIEQMAKAAQGIARGTYDQEVDVQGKDELGILAGAFNHMTARVRETMGALSENMQRYLTLFETSNDALYMMDGDTYLECNQKAVEIFGYSEGRELIGRTPLDFSPTFQPDGRTSREKADEFIRAALGGAPQFFYWQHQYSDQTLMDTEVSLNPLNLNGKTYLQAIVRDISERKQSEEQLKKSEEKYRTIFENAFEGIYQSTPNGRFLSANPALVRMFGYTSSEELISSITNIGQQIYLHPQDQEIVTDLLAKHGYIENFEVENLRKNGQPIWVSLNLHTVVDAHGDILYYEGAALDITQRRQMEQSLIDRSEELGKLVTHLEEEIGERKNAEDALKSEVERSNALARISTRLNATLGLQEVLDVVCEEIAPVLGAPVTIIWVVDDELKFHHVQAAFGLPHEIFQQIQPVPNRIHPLWQKKLDEIYYIPDIQEVDDNNNGPALQKLGLHTAINCLFYHEGRFVGLLTVLRKELAWNYSDADLTLLKTLSNQIAIVIHHARLYEQVKTGRERLQLISEKLVDVQEAERRHLATELHDEIGQALTHIKMSLDRFDPAHPEKGNLESAREITLDLMKRVRDLSLELRPTILDDLGLLPAVLWHIERYSALTGIQVDFKPSDVNQRFRASVESTAYRILQESLTNIARHSGATRVTVSLWVDEERLGLQVEDNGKGFDPDVSLDKMTGGLSGMQERARVCGGQLLIELPPRPGNLYFPGITLARRRYEREYPP